MHRQRRQQDQAFAQGDPERGKSSGERTIKVKKSKSEKVKRAGWDCFSQTFSHFHFLALSPSKYPQKNSEKFWNNPFIPTSSLLNDEHCIVGTRFLQLKIF
jgi:hypothetical protein